MSARLWRSDSLRRARAFSGSIRAAPRNRKPRLASTSMRPGCGSRSDSERCKLGQSMPSSRPKRFSSSVSAGRTSRTTPHASRTLRIETRCHPGKASAVPPRIAHSAAFSSITGQSGLSRTRSGLCRPHPTKATAPRSTAITPHRRAAVDLPTIAIVHGLHGRTPRPLLRYLDDQLHRRMNRAFDLDFSRLGEDDLSRLSLGERPQIERLDVRQRIDVVEKRIVVPEGHGVADLDFQCLDGERLVLLTDHELLRLDGSGEKKKQSTDQRRLDAHLSCSFPVRSVHEGVAWGPRRSESGVLASTTSSPSPSTGSRTRSRFAARR